MYHCYPQFKTLSKINGKLNGLTIYSFSTLVKLWNQERRQDWERMWDYSPSWAYSSCHYIYNGKFQIPENSINYWYKDQSIWSINDKALAHVNIMIGVAVVLCIITYLVVFNVDNIVFISNQIIRELNAGIIDHMKKMIMTYGNKEVKGWPSPLLKTSRMLLLLAGLFLGMYGYWLGSGLL